MPGGATHEIGDVQRPDPWELNELVRRRRLRDQARRPLAVNLAETLALSAFFGALRDAVRK